MLKILSKVLTFENDCQVLLPVGIRSLTNCCQVFFFLYSRLFMCLLFRIKRKQIKKQIKTDQKTKTDKDCLFVCYFWTVDSLCVYSFCLLLLSVDCLFLCNTILYLLLQVSPFLHRLLLSVYYLYLRNTFICLFLSVCLSVNYNLYLSSDCICQQLLVNYGVATISRLLQIIGLFCKRAL